MSDTFDGDGGPDMTPGDMPEGGEHTHEGGEGMEGMPPPGGEGDGPIAGGEGDGAPVGGEGDGGGWGDGAVDAGSPAEMDGGDPLGGPPSDGPTGGDSDAPPIDGMTEGPGPGAGDTDMDFGDGPPPGMEGMEDMASHMHDSAADMPPTDGGEGPHDHGPEPGADSGGEAGAPPPDADDVDIA